MVEEVCKFFVSFCYADAQLGSFNFAYCVIDVTGSKAKVTPGIIEDVVAYLKEKYENDVVILNVILLEKDRLDGLPEGLECKGC